MLDSKGRLAILTEGGELVVTLNASFGEPKYFEACPDPAAHSKKAGKWEIC